MASSIGFDPEYWTAIAPFADQPKPSFNNVHELRTHTEKLLAYIFRLSPAPVEVTTTKITLPSHDGAPITLYRFATESTISAPTPQPAVLAVHGGGMVSCTVDIFAPQLMRQSHSAGVQFFAVDYRLAPEFPAPCGVEDVFAALSYLSAHAAELNVDPARICLVGDSAGGGLAAGAALIARDRNLSPPVARMLLIYPMLDDRTAPREDDPAVDLMTWRPVDNRMAWRAVLGEDKAGDPAAEVSEYAVPARAGSLRGLPRTYIDVGGLDLFRDENLEFARRLLADDVEVEFHLWPGLPHGFEGAPKVSWTQRALASRNAVLKRL